MADLVLIVISLVLCGLATLYDVRKRIIPDWLTYSGIFLGVAAAALNTYALGMPFAMSYAATLLVGFCIGYGLFLLGIWAGGDTKLFWAMTALVGFSQKPDIAAPVIIFTLSAVLFLPAAFVLNSKALWAGRKECARIAVERAKKSVPAAAIAALAAAVYANYLVVLAVAFLFSAIGIPIALWLLVGLAAAAISLQTAATAFVASFALLAAIGTAMEISSKVIAPSLTTRVAVKDLKEGMLPARSVLLVKGKAVLFSPGLDMDSAAREIMAGNADARKVMERAGLLPPSGARVVVDSSNAGGLDAAALGRLKKLGKVRWLAVRKTEAFAPALCIAFLAFVAGII